MSTTPATINPELARKIFALVGFKGDQVRRAQAAMIYIALESGEVSADQIPPDMRPESTGANGAATKLLTELEILQFSTFRKSGLKDAHGRRLGVYTIRTPALARTWLARNGYPLPEAYKPETQLPLFNAGQTGPNGPELAGQPCPPNQYPNGEPRPAAV